MTIPAVKLGQRYISLSLCGMVHLIAEAAPTAEKRKAIMSMSAIKNTLAVIVLSNIPESLDFISTNLDAYNIKSVAMV